MSLSLSRSTLWFTETKTNQQMQLHCNVVNGTGHVIKDLECTSDTTVSRSEARLKHINNGLTLKWYRCCLLTCFSNIMEIQGKLEMGL